MEFGLNCAGLNQKQTANLLFFTKSCHKQFAHLRLKGSSSGCHSFWFFYCFCSSHNASHLKTRLSWYLEKKNETTGFDLEKLKNGTKICFAQSLLLEQKDQIQSQIEEDKGSQVTKHITGSQWTRSGIHHCVYHEQQWSQSSAPAQSAQQSGAGWWWLSLEDNSYQGTHTPQHKQLVGCPPGSRMFPETHLPLLLQKTCNWKRQCSPLWYISAKWCLHRKKLHSLNCFFYILQVTFISCFHQGNLEALPGTSHTFLQIPADLLQIFFSFPEHSETPNHTNTKHPNMHR